MNYKSSMATDTAHTTHTTEVRFQKQMLQTNSNSAYNIVFLFLLSSFFVVLQGISCNPGQSRTTNPRKKIHRSFPSVSNGANHDGSHRHEANLCNAKGSKGNRIRYERLQFHAFAERNKLPKCTREKETV